VSLRIQFLALLSLASVIAVTSARAGGNSPAFKVSSTLDGKRVLPARMRWIGYPKLPAAKVSKVDFLVDGRLRWVEHQPPYSYGGGDLKHFGFLITTWLAPGKHRFAARVTDRSGHKATDAVTARVLPAPAPPAALAGAWSRRVTPQDITKAGPGPPPPGRWRLIFDRVGAWHIDPDNGGVVNQYAARSGLTTDGQSSSLFLTFETQAGIGSFDFRVSSEPGWDGLEFFLNGVRSERWSGELAWQTYQFAVPTGSTRLEWRYLKDANFSSGLDAAFIDNLYLPGLAADTTNPSAGLTLYRLPTRVGLIKLEGQAARMYTLEASDDLRTWSPLTTNLLTGNLIFIEDLLGTNRAAGFYRAITR